MTTAYYPALIERGMEGFSVFFPDLPGCASGGDTIDQAARNAEDALSGHIALMIEDGDVIPAATALDAIKRDPDVDEVARILVRVDLPSKSIRLNISLDAGLVSNIDKTAEHIGMTRSGLIAAASRDYISRGAKGLLPVRTASRLSGKMVKVAASMHGKAKSKKARA